MDSRTPEFHQAAIRLLLQRATSFEAAYELLTSVRSENLTSELVMEAIAHVEADLPSPLRATLFDLGRIVSGVLPTDEIVAPPRLLKIYIPEN